MSEEIIAVKIGDRGPAGSRTAVPTVAGESETLVVPDLNSVVQNMRK